MIARLLFRLRGWWYRDIDHLDTALCVCCNKRLLFQDRTAEQPTHTRWFSIGSGVSICHRHPDNRGWPVMKWEHSNGRDLASLPLAHWHPRERASWMANNLKEAKVLGMRQNAKTEAKAKELGWS